ncbi:MAG TPA: PaaI family thioesterase [Acidimicrobiales bacterium]
MSTGETSAAALHRHVVESGQHLFSRLNLRDATVDGADLAVELELDPSLLNPRGALQGGLVATLVDIVAGRAATEGLEPSLHAVTADLNVHYMAPIVAGPAHAVGTVLRRGRRLVVVRVDVHDGRGGPLAAAGTSTFTVVRV